MTIAYKGALPDGRTKVQVEDWTGHANVKPYEVRVCPADQSRGLEIGFDMPGDAAACFAALCCGERRPEDYAVPVPESADTTSI